MLNEKELALMGLAESATAGPWMHLFGDRTVYDRMEDGCRGNAVVRADQPHNAADAKNLDFIAAANPATIITLLRELDGARFAAAQHLKTVEQQAAIIAAMPAPIQSAELAKLREACENILSVSCAIHRHAFDAAASPAAILRLLDAIAATAPVAAIQPAHEEIIREGDQLTRTACGTSTPVATTQPSDGAIYEAVSRAAAPELAAAVVAAIQPAGERTQNPFPEGSPNENWRRGYEGVRHFGARDSQAAKHWKMGHLARLADDKRLTTPAATAPAQPEAKGGVATCKCDPDGKYGLAAPVPAAPADKGELPPLPKCKMLSGPSLDSLHVLYTADQMRAYAKACILADRASQSASVLEHELYNDYGTLISNTRQAAVAQPSCDTCHDTGYDVDGNSCPSGHRSPDTNALPDYPDKYVLDANRAGEEDRITAKDQDTAAFRAQETINALRDDNAELCRRLVIARQEAEAINYGDTQAAPQSPASADSTEQAAHLNKWRNRALESENKLQAALMEIINKTASKPPASAGSKFATAEYLEAADKARDAGNSLYTPHSWEVRDAALEQAAEHVEGMIDNIGDAAAYDNREMYDSEMMIMHAHTEIAKRIRALKASPAPAAPESAEPVQAALDKAEWTLRQISKLAPTTSASTAIWMASQYVPASAQERAPSTAPQPWQARMVEHYAGGNVRMRPESYFMRAEIDDWRKGAPSTDSAAYSFEAIDAARWRYIEGHASAVGGGNGFTIRCHVPFDCEDMGCGVDLAIAALQPEGGVKP